MIIILFNGRYKNKNKNINKKIYWEKSIFNGCLRKK